MNFLNQFKNKFIPFDLSINVGETEIGHTLSKKPNITVDVVNNSVKLEKGPEIHEVYEAQVDCSFFLYTSNDKKVAEIHLSLTHSGEIISQEIIYYGPKNLILTHQKKDTSHSIIPYESFTFEKNTKTEKETLKIFQVTKNVVGANYSSKSKRKMPNVPLHTSLSSSLFTKPSQLEHYLETPYVSQGKDDVLLKYNATKAKFQKLFNCSDEKFEETINLMKGNTECDEFNPFISTHTILNKPNYICAYLANKEHNLLSGFRGNFIGSIDKYSLDNDTESCPLVVVTEQIKDKNTYRCYTLLDDADIDTIRSSNKDPKYVTKIGENGEEELVLYDGQPVSKLEFEKQTEAESSYASFVEEFIAPLSGIQNFNMEQFMKPRDLSQELR